FGAIELQPLPFSPWWIYTGGILGVTYIAFSALIVQHLGVLTFTLYSVGGQLIGALVLDLYLPSEGISVSWYLVSGIALTYVGVIIGGANQARRARM
ncbi:MAG: DMT family transporter, partial [Actinomycetota bacterium]